MSETPEQLRYTKEHEWAEAKDGLIYVGVTAYAVSELGDIAFVELPEVGSQVEAGGHFGDIESTKTVSELFAPVAGVVAKINDALTDEPQAVNDDPYGQGWMVAIEASDPAAIDALMSAGEYQALLQELGD